MSGNATGPREKKGLALLRERLRDPLLTLLTVILAVILFVIAPLQAAGNLAVHLIGIAFGLLLLATAFVVSGSMLAVTPILAAIALIVVATFLRFERPTALDLYLDATGWLLAGVSLAFVVARAVFAPGIVTLHRIVGAVLLYLTIGVIFVALFGLVTLVEPHAFSGLPPFKDDLSVAGDLVYFSFVTLTSVGYGDIVPLHPYARSLANIEAIIGQLYPATLLARLVTLEIEDRRRGR